MPSQVETNDRVIQTDHDRPIVFRTTNAEVYKRAVEEGSLWLRSSDFYRRLEDRARCDVGEGVNATTLGVPLKFKPPRGSTISISGDGRIGQMIVPHYILSLHGAGISAQQRELFGGYTFGIRCISRLSAEILYGASRSIKVAGYRFGQISYQRTALTRSFSCIGAAIGLGGNPPEYLGSINTDVLRKDPVNPFIEQDEWRIVVFTDGIHKDDPDAPLEIRVDPNHFYEYQGVA